MASRAFLQLGYAATALVLLFVTCQVRAEDGNSQDYYSHYKAPIPLTLDTQRVGVLAPGLDHEQDLAEALAPFGMAPDDVSGRPLKGWLMISTPAAGRTDAGARALIRQLSGPEAIRFASPVFTNEDGWPLMISPNLVVGFAVGVSDEQVEAIVQAAGAGEIIDRDYARLDGVYRVRSAFTNGFDVLAAANALAGRPEVRFAEPELIVSGVLYGAIPNDEQFFRCWGLHSTGQNIFEGLPDAICQSHFGVNCDATPTAIPDWDMDAPEAWMVTTGDPSVIAVVFDTGVQLDHPDLMVSPSLGMDFTGDGAGGYPVNVCDNHGTFVAGALGALSDNTIGATGIAPSCSVASARIGQADPPGAGGDCPNTWFIPAGAIIAALDWAQAIGARITNHSYGIGNVPAALAEKLSLTRDAGMIHFAAAGNNGAPPISLLASLPTTNAVAATAFLSQGLAPWSSFGEGLTFCAPGGLIYVTDRTGDAGGSSGWGDPAVDDYAMVWGTSFACPYAAGVAALVLSVDPTLTPAEVECIMAVSADDLGFPGYDTTFGWGLVNAADAVALAECQLCPGDLNCDGAVNVLDLVELLLAFGQPASSACDTVDVNGDGTVNVLDLIELLLAFGTSCP